MQIQFSGPAGVIEIPVDLAALPRPNGTVAAVPGERWNFTAWFRDGGPAGPSSNFSDAVEITFQ